MQEEHRIELQEALMSAKPKVIKDEKAILLLTTEMNAMVKRAERYRSERDEAKKELDSMVKRAERFVFFCCLLLLLLWLLDLISIYLPPVYCVFLFPFFFSQFVFVDGCLTHSYDMCVCMWF